MRQDTPRRKKGALWPPMMNASVSMPLAQLKQKAPPRTGPDSSLEVLNAEGAASFRLRNQFGARKRVPHDDA
jgi:hypothetical protein